ncbi:MAG: hypothetical protein OZ921_08520 [Sorangiineae bacterium]|nr:hypothetical protein [Polyangiaceae bacterium]MEB2322543.1 hypothetical protein [Sorangiineae bacterium]
MEQDPFLGRAERLGAMREVPCKGNWLAARRRYVEAAYGPAGIADVSARLDAELLEAFLRPPLAMAWTDLATVVGVDRAIFEGPMARDLSRMRHFGAEIAKGDIPTLYRAFFRLGTPSFVMKKLPVVYRQYFRRGGLVVETSAGSVEITLADLTMPVYLCAYGITGWFDAMLELVGARAAQVEHRACVHRGDAACVWRGAWRT